MFSSKTNWIPNFQHTYTPVPLQFPSSLQNKTSVFCLCSKSCVLAPETCQGCKNRYCVFYDIFYHYTFFNWFQKERPAVIYCSKDCQLWLSNWLVSFLLFLFFDNHYVSYWIQFLLISPKSALDAKTDIAWWQVIWPTLAPNMWSGKLRWSKQVLTDTKREEKLNSAFCPASLCLLHIHSAVNPRFAAPPHSHAWSSKCFTVNAADLQVKWGLHVLPTHIIPRLKC